VTTYVIDQAALQKLAIAKLIELGQIPRAVYACEWDDELDEEEQVTFRLKLTQMSLPLDPDPQV
jgi:hypothetical protein